MPRVSAESASSENTIPRKKHVNIVITCEKTPDGKKYYRPMLIFPSNNDDWMTSNTAYFQTTGSSNAKGSNLISNPDTSDVFRGSWLPTTGQILKPVDEHKSGWIMKLSHIGHKFHENNPMGLGSLKFNCVWLYLMLHELGYYKKLYDMIGADYPTETSIKNYSTKMLQTKIIFGINFIVLAINNFVKKSDPRQIREFCQEYFKIYYLITFVTSYFITWEQFQRSAQIGEGIWKSKTVDFDVNEYKAVFPDGLSVMADYSDIRNFVLSHSFDADTNTFHSIKKLSKINVAVNIDALIQDEEYVDCEIDKTIQDAYVSGYLKAHDAFVDAPEGYEEWVKRGTRHKLFGNHLNNVSFAIYPIHLSTSLFPYNSVVSNLERSIREKNAPKPSIPLERKFDPKTFVMPNAFSFMTNFPKYEAPKKEEPKVPEIPKVPEMPKTRTRRKRSPTPSPDRQGGQSPTSPDLRHVKGGKTSTTTSTRVLRSRK